MKWVFIFFIVMVKWVNAEPMVPCFFIFGDSLVDNGNNNDLKTDAKVNYPPYGIDFPRGPTGRFCNGKTTADFYAELLGFDHLIPPFANATGPIILQGVNYASGSAGILNDTGKHLGENIELYRQLENHGKTILEMFKHLNHDKFKVTEQLNKCMYFVGIGNNDYLNNYFMPHHYDSSKKYDINQFAELLIEQYSEYIHNLYSTGARKIVVTGLGNIGCIPFALERHFPAAKVDRVACVDKMNEATSVFNNKLVELVRHLNQTLRYVKFVYVNSTSLAVGDPRISGFTDYKTGCCNTRIDGQCKEGGQICPNRGAFVFWDSFHPSEASNQITAAATFNNTIPSITFPYDLRTLATQNS